MARYTVGAVKIGATTIQQITDSRIGLGIQAALARGSGAVENTFEAIESFDPRVTFTTQAVAAALSAIGCEWINLAESNAIVYFRQYAPGGTRTADGCIKVTFSKGILVFRRINAPHGSPATYTAEVVAASTDGTTDPWTYDTGQTYPDDVADELWTVSGSLGIQNWSIDSGIDVVQVRGDGLPYPTDCGVNRQQPTCDVEYQQLATLGSHAISAVTLQDYAQGAKRGTSSKTFTFNEKLSWCEELGSGEGQATARTRIHIGYDGTNAPILVS